MGKSYWRAITALIISLMTLETAHAADPTLDVVKKRGELLCGVNGSVPGFSLLNAVKEWEGLDVDILVTEVRMFTSLPESMAVNRVRRACRAISGSPSTRATSAVLGIIALVGR